MMGCLELGRFSYGPTATFGLLSVRMPERSPLYLYTVENPWRDNRPFVSCIPEGLYPVEWTTRNPKGRAPYVALRVLNVPLRSAILFHVANFATDVQGCIGTGLAYGPLYNKRRGRMDIGAKRSSVAHRRLVDFLKGTAGMFLSVRFEQRASWPEIPEDDNEKAV